jgi:hypothetical protein
MKKKLMVAVLAASLMIPGQAEAFGRGLFKRTMPLLQRATLVTEKLLRDAAERLISNRLNFVYRNNHFAKRVWNSGFFVSDKMNKLNNAEFSVENNFGESEAKLFLDETRKLAVLNRYERENKKLSCEEQNPLVKKISYEFLLGCLGCCEHLIENGHDFKYSNSDFDLTLDDAKETEFCKQINLLNTGQASALGFLAATRKDFVEKDLEVMLRDLNNYKKALNK